MGVTYAESVRMRRIEPMSRREIVDFYSSNGHAIPERFKGCEEARRERIIQAYSPDERNIFKR